MGESAVLERLRKKKIAETEKGTGKKAPVAEVESPKPIEKVEEPKKEPIPEPKPEPKKEDSKKLLSLDDLGLSTLKKTEPEIKVVSPPSKDPDKVETPKPAEIPKEVVPPKISATVVSFGYDVKSLKTGKLMVHKQFKKDGTLQESSSEELIEVQSFETTPAHVSVNTGLTVNLGDYESCKFDVHCSIPCYKEEMAEAYEFAKAFAQKRLMEEMDEVKKHKEAKTK